MPERPPVLVLPKGASLKRRRRSALGGQTDLADVLYANLRYAGLPLPEREYLFDAERAWRLDLCYVDIRLAIECEGVVGGAGGRHQRRAGYQEDCLKYDSAVLAGFTLLRFTGEMIHDGTALAMIETVLRRNGLLG